MCSVSLVALGAGGSSHIPKLAFLHFCVCQYPCAHTSAFAFCFLDNTTAGALVLSFLLFIVSASRSPPGLGSDTASCSPPGRGHRRSLRSVRYAMELFCISAFVLHSCTFVRIRDSCRHMFCSLVFFWRTWGTLLLLKMKKGHHGHPIVISPLSPHILEAILKSVFQTFPRRSSFARVIFKVVNNHGRVAQNQASLENKQIVSEVASRVNFYAISEACLLKKMHFL